MNRDNLAKLITGYPDVLQFAKDRKYEESWIISIKDRRPDGNIVDGYLKREKFDTLIAEYIWNSENDSSRFVLTFFLDKNCLAKDPGIFTGIILDMFFGGTSFDDILNRLDRDVVGHDYLFRNTPDGVNLSIFNHWLSAVPVTLWTPGDPYSKEKIIAAIDNRPELKKTTLNYQGLLFRFNTSGSLNGPYYGFKTPCCDRIGEEWVVNYAVIDHWMRTMLDIK